MNTKKDLWIEESPPTCSKKQNINLIKKLPTILRILGASAVLIAMYSFLIQGWNASDDMFRYFLMLGHTAALAAIGLASSYWLKESKGPRLLLTLSLISIPANFAILGAFIFSQTTAIEASAYPLYVTWSVDSLTSALLTNAIALFVLIPVTFLGFTVLARSMSKQFSILFLLSNATLLLPLRDPQLVGFMVLALTFVVIAFSRKISRQNAAAKTNEGILALGLPLLPLAVLIGRSLWLYSTDLFLLTVLPITAFFILRQISLSLSINSKVKHVLQGLSVLSAISFGLSLIVTLKVMADFSYTILFPLATVISMAMIYEISYRSHHRASLYRYFAVAGLVIGMSTNLFFNTDFVVFLMVITVALGMIFSGYKLKQKNLFSGGVILIFLGITLQLYEWVGHFEFGSWVGLAMLGVASIVIASVMESQSGNIKLRFIAWKAKLVQWEK